MKTKFILSILFCIGSDIHWSKPKPKAIFWINIQATPTENEKNDNIADFGEKWDVKDLSPNINYKCNTHHELADVMFKCILDQTGSAQNHLLESIKQILQ